MKTVSRARVLEFVRDLGLAPEEVTELTINSDRVQVSVRDLLLDSSGVEEFEVVG